MQLKNVTLSLVSAIALLGLSGCARYQAKPLRKITKAPEKQAEHSVSFEYELFTKVDCMQYLDRDVIAKGYQPIQVSFANSTDRVFTVSPANFSLNCVDVQEVASKAHTNTAGRAGGYGAAAVTTIAAPVVATAVSHPSLESLAIGLIVTAIALPIATGFAAAAIVDGRGSAQANEYLDADFAHKALTPNHVLNPHGTVEGLIFVPCCDVKDEFTVSISDQKNNENFVLSTAKPMLKI